MIKDLNLSEPPGGHSLKHFAISKIITPRIKWTANLDSR